MTAEAIVFLWVLVSPPVACLHMLVPIATIPVCHSSGFAVGNPAWVAARAWKAATMSASWRCERPEASVVTKSCHHRYWWHRYCPYMQLMRTWGNPAAAEDGDDQWYVTACIQLRGPPEHRFAQLVFAVPEEAGLDDADAEGGIRVEK